MGHAILDSIILYAADLRGADVTGTNLSGADLSDTKGFTKEELEQQVMSLANATMPNGQKYEEWLKSRNGNE